VGRATELAHLDRWLDEARHGSPRFIVLSGEPGMGTTRLADEVQARARQSGLRVLAGRCFEDVAVPYLPMMTALRPLLASDDTPVLEPLLGRGALSAAADANDLALYIGVAEALLDATKDAALLLSLDALQWDDRATLDLLAHVVGALAQAANDATVPACVLITVGGSTADLDRLAGGTLVADLDVTGLDAGSHDVPVTADLPAGVTLVGASPANVTVTVRAPGPASPTPTPTTTASPGPTGTPTPTPSPGG
jgi:hypothetical protein